MDPGRLNPKEDWSGARGVHGKSLNMYSAADHKWHLARVQSQGALLAWRALAGRVCRLYGPTSQSGGNR